MNYLNQIYFSINVDKLYSMLQLIFRHIVACGKHIPNKKNIYHAMQYVTRFSKLFLDSCQQVAAYYKYSFIH